MDTGKKTRRKENREAVTVRHVYLCGVLGGEGREEAWENTWVKNGWNFYTYDEKCNSTYSRSSENLKFIEKILLMDIVVKLTKPSDEENSCKAPRQRQDTQNRTSHASGQKPFELERTGVRDNFTMKRPPAVCLFPVRNIFKKWKQKKVSQRNKENLPVDLLSGNIKARFGNEDLQEEMRSSGSGKYVGK